MTLDVLQFSSQVKKAARIVSLQWPGVMEADDVEQTIYMKLLESPGTIEKVKDLEPKARDRFLTRMGHQIASRERTEYAHYKGNYRYSVGEVKDLLKAGALNGLELDPDVQSYDSQGSKPVGGESKPPIKAEVLDLRAGLELLRDRNKSYHDAIITRYLFDEQPNKDALSRGLKSLADEMNRVNRTAHVTRDDGPGTRGPITREQARYESKDGWDADYTPAPVFMRDNHIEKEVWE